MFNRTCFIGITTLMLLGSLSMAYAQVPLDSVLGNLGFEDDLEHSQWTATLPNNNYQLDAPVVNPVIIPLGAVDPLLAPAGANFVGVLNPEDDDINGKLVHDPVAIDPASTTFEVTVWGVRGRLAGASSPAFTNQPSRLRVAFTGWGAGSVPVVNPATDDWSRRPAVRQIQEFTAWGVNGDWSQVPMVFTTPIPLAYVTLSIWCTNHVHASFCGVDLE